MISIRAMDTASDAASILRLWSISMGRDFPLDERLLRQQLRLEESPALLLGAFESGSPARLSGAILAKRVPRPDSGGGIPAKGNISFLAVDPDRRRRGIGSALLAAAEEWLLCGYRADGSGSAGGADRDMSRAVAVGATVAGGTVAVGLADGGGMELRFGADRWHFFPGIPEPTRGHASAAVGGPEEPADAGDSGADGFAPARAFALARGFAPGALEHDVAADLECVDPFGPGTGATRIPGYRATAYREELRENVREFFALSFPGRWRRDVERMLDAGMRGEDLLLLVEESTGRVRGFALLFSLESAIYGPALFWRELMGETPGGLGPIGVEGSLRGKGLGLFLLAAGLSELKSRGCRFTVIDWTDLLDFYAKFGFGIWKSYRMYSKHLVPSRTPQMPSLRMDDAGTGSDAG
jgi:predicted N-acetyltransferase YhbS